MARVVGRGQGKGEGAGEAGDTGEPGRDGEDRDSAPGTLPIFVPDQHLSLNQAHRRPGCISSGASRELETTSVPWLRHERNCPVLESPHPPAASASSQQPPLCPVGRGLLPRWSRLLFWLFHVHAPPSASHSPNMQSPHALSSLLRHMQHQAWPGPLVPKHVAFRAGQRLKLALAPT